MKVPIILERYYKNTLSKTRLSLHQASDGFCPLKETKNWPTRRWDTEGTIAIERKNVALLG